MDQISEETARSEEWTPWLWFTEAYKELSL
jgi:hypothetical protein